MKVLLRIVLWLFVIVVLVVLIGFLLPKSVTVERTASINTPPNVVYNILNDLNTYDQWMPWNKIDPEMKKEFGPKTVGQNAWYRWESKNRNVGHGKLTIVQSVPSEKVVTSLEFADFDPTEAGWILNPQGNNTMVKWYMNSNMGNNPVARWMGLFMNRMVGPDFEKGLADLKKLAESRG